MRILSVITLILTILSSCAHTQGIMDAAVRSKKWVPYNKALVSFEPETRKEHGLVGNVRKVMARNISSDAEPQHAPGSCEYWVYDRSGRLVRTCNATYVYNKTGHLLTQTETDSRFEFERDKFGKLYTKVIYIRRDGEMHRDSEETFDYDSRGRLIQYIPAFHEAMFCAIFSFYYDSRDRLTKVYSYSGQMETFSEHTQLLIYHGNTVSADNLEYTHDNKGRLTCLELKNQSVETHFPRPYDIKYKKSTYKYNAQGLVTEQEDTAFDDKTTKTRYTYDSYSNLLKVVKQSGADKPEKTEEYSYKYDKRGNWIEKDTVIGDEPSVRRTIIYYN